MDIFSYLLGKKSSGGGGGSKLPPEFQEVEYIESTGTQYINTTYLSDSNSSFEFKITYKTSRGIVFGAYNSYWDSGYGYYHNNGNGDNEFEHYYGNYNTGYKGINNVTQKIVINKGNVYIDGNSIYTVPTKTFSMKQPTFIFGGNWAGQRVEQPLECKIYYFKIKNDSFTIMNFIPCYRKTDSEVGMYDILNDTFYTNAGTGSFIKGPDVTA